MKDRMFAVLKFVNNLGEIMKRFFGMVNIYDNSVKSLKNVIYNFLGMNRLLLLKVRNQYYDDVSNISCEFNVVNAITLIEKENSSDLPCFAY